MHKTQDIYQIWMQPKHNSDISQKRLPCNLILDNHRSRHLLRAEKLFVEDAGIDPATSHMLSARSTTWANPPIDKFSQKFYLTEHV